MAYTEEMAEYDRQQAERLQTRGKQCTATDCRNSAEIGALCYDHHQEMVSWSNQYGRQVEQLAEQEQKGRKGR
jgi:protein-tyrosine-phosphatase